MNRRQKRPVNVKANQSQKPNKRSKSQKSSDKNPQVSPVEPPTKQNQINLENQNQAAQKSSTPLPTTMHSKLKEAYTDTNNPLAYTGDANKLMNQIKSFKYVHLQLIFYFYCLVYTKRFEKSSKEGV